MASAEEVDTASQGIVRTLKDLFAGAAGGVAQVLIGLSNFTSFNPLLLHDRKELGPSAHQQRSDQEYLHTTAQKPISSSFSITNPS